MNGVSLWAVFCWLLKGSGGCKGKSEGPMSDASSWLWFSETLLVGGGRGCHHLHGTSAGRKGRTFIRVREPKGWECGVL